MTDIPGYEGIYAITRDGRVYSHAREIGGQGKRRKGKYLRLKAGTRGYSEVGLVDKYKKRKYFLVHRIVASVYIDKIEGKNYVNHINNIRTDNRVENLEWCTQLENIRHAINNFGWRRDGVHNGRYSHGKRVDKLLSKEK